MEKNQYGYWLEQNNLNYNNKFYTERQNNQTSLRELFLEDYINGVLISNLNYWGKKWPFGVT